MQIYRRREVVKNEEEGAGRGNEEKDLMWWVKGHGFGRWKGFFLCGGGYKAMNLSVRFEERNKDVPACDIVALLKFALILTISVKSTLAPYYSVLQEGWSMSTDLVPILSSAKVIPDSLGVLPKLEN
jgi:hypothetical protein